MTIPGQEPFRSGRFPLVPQSLLPGLSPTLALDFIDIQSSPVSVRGRMKHDNRRQLGGIILTT
jgi:hypothetical protein